MKRELTPATAHTFSASTLRRKECGWCGQRLDRAIKGQCGAVHGERGGCELDGWASVARKATAK